MHPKATFPFVARALGGGGGGGFVCLLKLHSFYLDELTAAPFFLVHCILRLKFFLSSYYVTV